MFESTGTKIVFVLSLSVMVIVGVFFVLTKDKMNDTTKKIENITGLNVDTYDYDMYVYDIDSDRLYTSEYFYNKIYLDNNEVKYDEFYFDNETLFFLKTYSNTAMNIKDIKVTYDPITTSEFDFLLENYSLLKVDIWVDDNGICDKVLLYANNDVSLDLEGY